MGRPTEETKRRLKNDELKALESVVRAAKRLIKNGFWGRDMDGVVNAIERLDRWRRIHK